MSFLNDPNTICHMAVFDSFHTKHPKAVCQKPDMRLVSIAKEVVNCPSCLEIMEKGVVVKAKKKLESLVDLVGQKVLDVEMAENGIILRFSGSLAVKFVAVQNDSFEPRVEVTQLLKERVVRETDVEHPLIAFQDA